VVSGSGRPRAAALTMSGRCTPALAGRSLALRRLQNQLRRHRPRAFSVVAAVFFHMDFADPAQTISFMKNLAIAGGLLVLAQAGAAAPSVDTARSTYETLNTVFPPRGNQTQ
jgi:hypothetical protein